MVDLMEHSPSTRAEVSDLLARYHILATSQRVEIALILLSKPQHLSADQVLVKVNRHGPVVSKATVYNTLKLFAEKGLIRQVIVDASKVFYDPNTAPHHHFYHIDSATLIDFDAGKLSIASMPELPKGTEAEGVDIIIRVRNKT